MGTFAAGQVVIVHFPFSDLTAIPVLGQRRLAQQRGVVNGGSFLKNRDERAARRQNLNRLN